MIETLAVAAGGALGSVARYWLGILALPLSRQLPWGTIGINVAGSFAIAFFGTLTLGAGRYPVPETGRLFFMVGVCGGFTTFSSFSLQTLDLLRGGAPGRAMANVALSVSALPRLRRPRPRGRLPHLNGGARQVTQTIIEEESGVTPPASLRAGRLAYRRPATSGSGNTVVALIRSMLIRLLTFFGPTAAISRL